MERFLGQEGWLFRFLDRLWDLIVLNVLFIITCIPLFNICTVYGNNEGSKKRRFLYCKELSECF